MFEGAITALITPMNRQQEIDKEAFSNLIEWQIEQGIHGLVPCGTTGESSTLSSQERADIIKFCIQTVKGRVPVIAGTGSNNTRKTIEVTQYAKDVGADAALIVTPYYNNPGQEGAVAHFKTVADHVALPIILYNVPGRTILDLSAETVSHLSQYPNIIGIKDATGNMERVNSHALACKKDFVLLSGDDATAYTFNTLGGKGCISVVSNIVPKMCANFQEACKAEDWKTALELHRALFEIHKAAYLSPSPGPVKYALSQLFKMQDIVRLPLLPASVTARDAMDLVLKRNRVL